MQLACPNCGMRDARVAHPQGLGEFMKSLIGICQLRCRGCKNRWETSVLAGGAWKYARCPRCYRQELTSWDRSFYNPPRWTLIRMSLGASPYRCEACRCNFSSFRPRKARFSRRHRIRVTLGQTPPEEESKE